MAREGTHQFKLDDLDERLGQRVRDARNERGLSRMALAPAAGVSRSTIAHIERGDQRPLPGTLRKIAAVLSLPLFVLAPAWEDAEHVRPKSGTEHPGVGLRAIRRDRKLTIAALAEATGLSVSTISRFERGLHATRKLTCADASGTSYRDQIGIISAELAAALGYASAADLTRACAAIEE
ncbi:helix-turn-helix transcriptional regulator [Sphingomonas naphthae]|uniref:Helix-turn-helix transcriptional regulator n=1 Tax=Sphingomonas naphthae TaxID=1813468 RepID=A0ABY7TMH4_9SPHN|nr:helix-turn-helix transcriptional regulator [Sphingomonas naphthae]WCT74196.1 helix-turn-helix transcriptional regulator [Sphingomonas naphthae]